MLLSYYLSNYFDAFRLLKQLFLFYFFCGNPVYAFISLGPLLSNTNIQFPHITNRIQKTPPNTILITQIHSGCHQLMRGESNSLPLDQNSERGEKAEYSLILSATQAPFILYYQAVKRQCVCQSSVFVHFSFQISFMHFFKKLITEIYV